MQLIQPPGEVSLDDKYRLGKGVALMSGTQALVRLPMLQKRRDEAQGLKTAGFISGYRGSPIGTYDRELWRARELLREHEVRFVPGVNEDLAATAVWGSQQVGMFPGPYDGVFALWYGKGPGVDRSGDPLKHGNFAGAAPAGGVLVAAADDPAAKSSTVIQQSELPLSANSIPVLYPSNVREILEYGLLGWAMSRHTGLWVGLKLVNETLETDATVLIDNALPRIVLPAVEGLPPSGINFQPNFNPLHNELLTTRYRLPLVHPFARANRLNGSVHATPGARFGIIGAGKTFGDVLYALRLLGIDRQRAHSLRIDAWKLGLIWPLDGESLRSFAGGLEELLVVEEKRPFLESQIYPALYGLARRPRLSGKCSPEGEALLAADGTLTPTQIALAIGERLLASGVTDEDLRRCVDELRSRTVAREALVVAAAMPTDMKSGEIRTPYFCSGCPHNTSTRVPDSSVAFSGIGCHTMAIQMDRSTLAPTHMGGEGANWIGIAPFVDTPHVFQNLGDGTYYHSGLMAIRAAIAARVNITYKILFNQVVAMTGGQPLDGPLTVADVARQVLAEGVARCMVVTVAPEAYRDGAGDLPTGVVVHGRTELDAIQRELREISGVTVLIYEQICAAEKRRLIKRNQLPRAPRRAFINMDVCEGCGDCSTQSNCVSVLPVETELGRKRAIDQSSCNEDLSCIRGFCPAFVLVRGAAPRRRTPRAAKRRADALPLPRSDLKLPYSVLVTGIGGTGVITVGAVLAMAARLEGTGASTYNMTGLSQKNGAVYSHLRFVPQSEEPEAARIDTAGADLLLACDVLAALAIESVQTIRTSHTHAVINSTVEPTAAFQQFRDSPLPGTAQCQRLARLVGPERTGLVDATGLAQSTLGDKIGGNLVVVGYAYQMGLLPLRIESIERAIELNGVAVEMNLQAVRIGREAAVQELERSQQRVEPQAAPGVPPPALAQIIERGRGHLTAYQSTRYADGYVRRVEAIAAVESQRVPGEDALARTAALQYRRLLAYKDEYEVARLYNRPEFRASLRDAFEGKLTLTVLLAPPALGGAGRHAGAPRKREFGPWVFTLFAVLARLKFLRGTALDPFGHAAERRMERSLLREYEAWIDEVTVRLTASNHDLAVKIASIPERIRGYGHIKTRSVQEARAAAAQLLERFRARAS
jgi:indolepyruvate ferredoxin oxidoreductase